MRAYVPHKIQTALYSTPRGTRYTLYCHPNELRKAWSSCSSDQKELHQRNVFPAPLARIIGSCSSWQLTHPKKLNVPYKPYPEILATAPAPAQHQVDPAHSHLCFFFKGDAHPLQRVMHCDHRTGFAKMLPDSRQGYTGLLLQQFPKLLLIGGGKSRRSVPTRLGRQALLLPTCVEPVVDTGDRVVCEFGYLPNSVLPRLNRLDGQCHQL